MNAIALWIGYIVLALVGLFIAWETFAWLMWPVWSILAELRMLRHRFGWRYLLRVQILRRLPVAYVLQLRSYWDVFGGYGEKTRSWESAVWYAPTHPLSPGRMEFREPVSTETGSGDAGLKEGAK